MRRPWRLTLLIITKLSMFKIGEKVECVEPKAGCIEDGHVYTVKATKVCRCGMKKVILTEVDLSKKYGRSKCIKCGEISENPSWLRAIRFVRYKDDKFAEEILEKIKKSIYKLT